MLIPLDFTLLVLATILALPLGMFVLEVFLSLLPRRPTTVAGGASGQLAVLIPAHNEEAVLASTLRTLVATLPPDSRVLVVADNCTDDTAEIARRHGAEAIERFDRERRGKGFALDFGIRHLAADPPGAVVFLDADCQVAPDTVRLLGHLAIQSGRPVQGLNLCDPDPSGGVLQAVSGLAFRFKNLVRTLGLTRLAGLSHLTGTGMALPWALALRSKLADGNVVEDMQLGIDLALAGHNTLFLPEARVTSPLPQQHSAARTQRTRWEHGHLKTLLTQVPRLLALSIRHRRLDLAWLALDLSIPPLSLLALVWAVLWLASIGAWLAGSHPLAASVLSAQGGCLTIAVLLGWAAHCRRQVPLRALVLAPLYAVWKLPIYAAFLIKRQREWIRTERLPAKGS